VVFLRWIVTDIGPNGMMWGEWYEKETRTLIPLDELRKDAVPISSDERRDCDVVRVKSPGSAVEERYDRAWAHRLCEGL